MGAPLQIIDGIAKSRLATKTEAAEFFGVSRSDIDEWVKEGCPVLHRGRTWTLDLLEVARWHFTPKALPEPELEPEPEPEPEPQNYSDPEHMLPQDRKAWYEGEDKRLRLLEKKRELIHIEEMRDILSAVFKRLVTTLNLIPDLLERETGLTHDQMEIMERVIDDERQQLHDDLVGSKS